MAINDFFEDFCVLDWKSVPNGIGGVIWEATDGVVFRAGIVMDSTTQARIAYQTGAKIIYTIAMDKGMVLEINDGIKRMSDGQMFRITSNSRDMQTPDISQMNLAQVTAEVMDI